MRLPCRPLAALLLFGGCLDASLSKFNDPPSAAITWPSSEAALLEGELIVATGQVDDPESGPAGVAAGWQIDGVGLCEEEEPSAEGDISCSFAVPLGDFELALVAEDPSG